MLFQQYIHYLTLILVLELALKKFLYFMGDVIPKRIVIPAVTDDTVVASAADTDIERRSNPKSGLDEVALKENINSAITTLKAITLPHTYSSELNSIQGAITDGVRIALNVNGKAITIEREKKRVVLPLNIFQSDPLAACAEGLLFYATDTAKAKEIRLGFLTAVKDAAAIARSNEDGLRASSAPRAATYSLDLPLLGEMLRTGFYNKDQREKFRAWQACGAELDQAVKGGNRDSLTEIFAKLINVYFFLRSKDHDLDATEMREAIARDLANNLATYIAVKQSSSQDVHSRMLEAMRHISESHINPTLLRDSQFADFISNLQTKFGAIDFSSRRAKDFTLSIIGNTKDRPRLTGDLQESAALIGIAGPTSNNTNIRGHLGGPSGSRTESNSASHIINPLIAESGLYPSALPAIQTMVGDLVHVDLDNKQSIQAIVPEQIFTSLNLAVKREQDKIADTETNPFKSINEIQEYLKMLALAISEVSGSVEKFTKKNSLPITPVPLLISQIVLAYFNKIKNTDIENQFRDALTTLDDIPVFKGTRALLDMVVNVEVRKTQEAKQDEAKVEVGAERHGFITERAQLLTAISKHLNNNNNSLEKIDLNKHIGINSPLDFEISAKGFLHRIASLNDESIHMLNSSFEEAKIILFYLVTGSKLLVDFKRTAKPLKFIDPSQEDRTAKFQVQSFDQVLDKFNKGITRTQRPFHPDIARTLHENLKVALNAADLEQRSAGLSSLCFSLLADFEPIADTGRGWADNSLGRRITAIREMLVSTGFDIYVGATNLGAQSGEVIQETHRLARDQSHLAQQTVTLSDRVAKLESLPTLVHNISSGLLSLIEKIPGMDQQRIQRLGEKIKQLVA